MRRLALLLAMVAFAITPALAEPPAKVTYGAAQCQQIRTEWMSLKGRHIDRFEGNPKQWEIDQVNKAHAQADTLRQQNAVCFSRFSSSLYH